MRNIHSQQQHRLRSVKYKIKRHASISINQVNRDNKISLPSTNTSKYLGFKSRKNGNKFSITFLQDQKNNSQFNNQTIEQQRNKKLSYMDTFHFMLNMERNKFNAKIKQKQQQQQLKQREKQRQLNPQCVQYKPNRVHLPILNQLDSYFTVLDNINLPINYINQQLPRINKQLQIEQQIIKKLHLQLKQIQKTNIKQLKQLQQIGKKGFEKLRNMIKLNNVNLQQQNLKNKNGIQKCKDYLPQFYQQLQENKQKVKNLQDIIFKATPYQLSQKQQFQLISSKYF